MLVTIISWIYILIVSLSVGYGMNRLLSKFVPVPDKSNKHFGVTGYVVTGLVTLTVYAETFSIFYKVGAVCHILMLLCAIASGVVYRADLKSILFGKKNGNSFAFIADISSPVSRRNFLIVCAAIISVAAFFTSRGEFHTDTGIYHAQAIRLIEEYGLVKGLGNLQLHYAYNSAYLPLCALFTLGFMLPLSLHLHTMTGFFMVLFTLYAVRGLWHYGEHHNHSGDLARVALLIYSLTIMTGLQSPATDYATMLLVLYIFTAWISYATESSWGERHAGGPSGHDKFCATHIAFYGYLSVLAIFSASMKLSAAFIVLIAILPLVLLLKKKMWKETALFLLVGFLSFLPYLARNVIISGWLFYPVASIDLFNVIWKIPVEYLKHDSDQIKVWARCLYDVTRVDDGILDWLPIWFSEKAHYEEMLIYSQFLGVILLVIAAIRRFREKTFDPAVVLFFAVLFVNMLVWFVTAPFIRYGLAYLLLLPLCAVGDNLENMARKKNVILIGLSAIVAINFFSWIDNYFTDCCVFAKHHVAEAYYVAPEPFEFVQTTPIDMDGVTVYAAGFDEVNSYYFCPGTCYDDMAARTKLIGKSFEEGLMAR